MHRLIRALAAVFVVGVVACAEDSVAPRPEAVPSFSATGDDADGRHVVVFTTNAIPADFAASVAALGGTVERTYPQVGVATTIGLSAEAATALGAGASINSVNPDYLWTLDAISSSAVDATDVGAASPANPATAFFYPRQWHMRQVGANTAWAAGRLGSPSVKVAILDSGLSPTHPDLVGLIDAAGSISFIPSDDALVDQFFPGLPYWIDLRFHGTHVGATVASNAFAAAGVTSMTTLMAVKVLSVNGTGPFSAVFAGIMHAADNGADVINMSLGTDFLRKLAPGFVAAVNRTLAYANARGVTVVVAAGNSAIDLDKNGNGYNIFCSAPNVICVSATGPTSSGGVNGPWVDIDASAPYTNFGRSAINVAAPGGNTGGAVWAACSQQSLVIPVCRTGAFVVGVTGTSMASPHTAGLAALLVESIGRDPGAVRAAIQQGALDLGPKGTDKLYGKGRIRVPNSLGL